MWELIFSFLAIIYLLIAFRLLAAWLKLLKQDVNDSPSEQCQSIAILITIAIFWPLCLPFAYLELLNKKNQESKTVENKSEMYGKSHNIVWFYEKMKL